MANREDAPISVLRQRFGFSDFRPGQEAVISALLAGRSALAVFPTGSGKSLCYQLPALLLPGLTVVISPLIALMKDQIDFLTRRGIAAARLDSTLSRDEQRATEQGMQDGTLRLLYVSPERFNNERFLGRLRRLRLALFAVDEAHCISEWGHNFRPDYLKLAETARDLNVERVLCLTATATPSVAEHIRQAFDIAPEDAVVTGFYRPNLLLATTPVTASRRDELLLARLAKRPPGPTILYVTLQKTAERVAALLRENGYPAQAYHAGMENEERTAVQETWMTSERGIVVATIAFGMGIDRADVRYVYHYNLPKSLESYSQEIGRAGRDGKTAIVEMFACPEDVPVLENFSYGDTPSLSALRHLVEDLLARGTTFDVSLYDLSQRHDVRPLVLKTALTYLELQGVLKQGTPRYAGYEFRPTEGRTPEGVAAEFPGTSGELVGQLFAVAKKGRVWFGLDPETAAEATGTERTRIVRALEVMEERGLIELRATDARQTYTRLREVENPGSLAEDLMGRFEARETGDIARIRQVLDLVTLAECQVNALTRYFGERRSEPCGHCTFCKVRRAASFTSFSTGETENAGEAESSVLDAGLREEVAALRQEYPEALGEDRQIARFLCGLTSPALTRHKLHRHSRFGACETVPFAVVRESLAGERADGEEPVSRRNRKSTEENDGNAEMGNPRDRDDRPRSGGGDSGIGDGHAAGRRQSQGRDRRGIR
ncbi:MAG: RecQ family ATP-dependent DNA helicase [Bacteroidia bacterium]|nr:RecQ family ATP-dependent DNA helicase [Bacteroidia bacterium]